jgi:hypothetical protein
LDVHVVWHVWHNVREQCHDKKNPILQPEKYPDTGYGAGEECTTHNERIYVKLIYIYLYESNKVIVKHITPAFVITATPAAP